VGKIMRHFVYLYGKVWLWLARPFVKIERKHLERQAGARPCIMVVNHGSLFDIFLMSVMPDFDVVIYLRAWPFKMRWFAPFMRGAQYQDIESQPWETVETVTRRFVAEGLSIMVFPEGHRSRDGRMGRFYSGAFWLALHNRIPVVPVCIRGSDRLLPPGRLWLKPATIRIACLEPVDPTPFTGELGHIALRKHVKARMEASLARD
jgi:1-acyl-sn-glycerol-3-phosphate acyltransferase